MEQLKAHIPDQTIKIRNLINEPICFANFLESPAAPSWTTFRDAVWGKALASTPPKASEGQGDLGAQHKARMDIDVDAVGARGPSESASTHPVMKLPETIKPLWSFKSSHVLVREEYEEAEKAALEANAGNFDAFLVTGQSGIGKSVFLAWLLIRRLELRLPTALQLESSEAVLFHEDGVSHFQSLPARHHYMTLEPNNPSSRIWVLVDSNPTLLEPAPIFRMGLPFFVVESASRQDRLKWSKKLCYIQFCMKTWTFSEVLQLHPFLANGRFNVSALSHLHHEYRASPRDLAIYADRPEAFEALVAWQVKLLYPENLRNILILPDSDELSHVLRIEPSPTRDFPLKTIASPGAFKLLWNKHLNNELIETAYFYDLFAGRPVTAPAAGWIFEFRMHHLLSQGYTLKLFPLRDPSRGKTYDTYSDYKDTHMKTNEKTIQLAASAEYPFDSGTTLRVGRYYRPTAKNFAAFDALFLIETLIETTRPTSGLASILQCAPPTRTTKTSILIMFQITRNREQHVKETGLDMIDALTLPPNTLRYYVAVTPDDAEPLIQVPKGRFSNVTTFHHPVPRSTLFPCKSKENEID